MEKDQKQVNLGWSIVLRFGNLEHHPYIHQTTLADTSHQQQKQLQLHLQNTTAIATIAIVFNYGGFGVSKK